MIRVRFHLAKGKNFKKWQVKYPDGAVKFFTPEEVTIYMHGCKLRNQKGTAEKIFGGADKTVCAWIDCESIDIVMVPIKNGINCTEYSYNPRVKPYWVCDGDDVDMTEHDELFTSVRDILEPQ